MKKFNAIIFAFILILSLCACSTQSTNVFSENKQSQSASEDAPLSDPQSGMEVIRPLTEATLPAVEETDDTRLAVDFIHDFYETLVSHNENALDLNKYFNNGELKEQMTKCKETLLEKKELYEKDYFALDYAAAVSDKVTDGVHLITVDYAYHFRYSDHPYDPQNPDEGWSGAGMRAPFAIKDGKIVNLEVSDIFKALPADEDVPEVQIILSHITAPKNGSFELDGVTYQQTGSGRNVVIEDGGFVKLFTSDGLIDPNAYDGQSDELIDSLRNIFSLKNIGNTGRLEVGDIVFDDARIYQSGENMLVIGEVDPSYDFDMDLGRYCNALLFSPT